METHKPQFSFLSTTLVDAIMDVFLDVVKGESMIGLATWHILNPKTLKDKADPHFKKTNKPLHFLELANAISSHFNTKVKKHRPQRAYPSCRVRPHRSWYLRSQSMVLHVGTVQDVILEIFTQLKKPMSLDEITAEVLKTRIVKSNTISTNLQNKKVFECVGRNLYQPKA